GCRRRAVARPRHLLCHGGRKPDAVRHAALAARASNPAGARTRNRAVHPWSCLALDRARARADPRPARIRKYRCVTVFALLFEVTSYDLRFGANRLHDRYLFYLVPLLLISCAAMVREREWPRWAAFGAGALLAMAFAFMPVVRYDKFNVDSPVALLNEPLLGIAGSVNGARALLAFVTIAVTLLLMVGRRVALAVVVVGALAIPALAGGAFTRLLAHDGTSGRPITVDQSVVFDWID